MYGKGASRIISKNKILFKKVGFQDIDFDVRYYRECISPISHLESLYFTIVVGQLIIKPLTG